MNDGWVKSVDEERDLVEEYRINLMYKSYVRPHLEYCIQFSSPINEKDEDMLEGL